MKNLFLVFLLILASCGYQPLYKKNQNIVDLKINNFKVIGDEKISNQIYSKLPFVLIENDENLNKLVIESEKNISISSKNSKGQATSYKTFLNVKISILNIKNEVIDQKIITKNFAYNSDENKFRFKEYQNKVEKNLIDEIVEEIITHLYY